MELKPKIAFLWRVLCIICMVVFMGYSVSAQKVDSAKISYKPKPKVVSRVPQIKANITPYKPNTGGFGLGNSQTSVNLPAKNVKNLAVLKVYPNPVGEQVNISLKLDREASLVIKITDMLGNDVLNLANELSAAGEQTKTYLIPSKLNTGMYFLKVIAGGEQIVKRISVL